MCIYTAIDMVDLCSLYSPQSMEPLELEVLRQQECIQQPEALQPDQGLRRSLGADAQFLHPGPRCCERGVEQPDGAQELTSGCCCGRWPPGCHYKIRALFAETAPGECWVQADRKILDPSTIRYSDTSSDASQTYTRMAAALSLPFFWLAAS